MYKSFHATWNPAASASAWSFIPRSFVFPTLLMGISTKRKAVVSLRIFWRPWQNGWVSITVMRLQEWPPRFLHLRHLSPRLLQGIQSFLYNSLLSLLLLPLSFALWSHSPFYYLRNLQEVCTFGCAHEGEIYHMRSLRLMRNAGICSAPEPSVCMNRASMGRVR